MQPGNQTVTFVVLSPVLGQQGSRGDGRAGECSVLERRASGLPVPVSRWCRRAGRGGTRTDARDRTAMLQVRELQISDSGV